MKLHEYSKIIFPMKVRPRKATQANIPPASTPIWTQPCYFTAKTSDQGQLFTYVCRFPH